MQIVDIVSVLNACVGLSEIIHTVFQLLDLRPHYKQDREGGEVGWFKFVALFGLDGTTQISVIRLAA